MKYRTVMAVLVLGLALAASGAQAACVEFDNLMHCSIGNAELQLSPNGSKLVARKLGPEGNDGVGTLLGAASSWRGKFRNIGWGVGDAMTLTSVADGFDTSEMRMRKTASGGLEITAEFTGALDLSSYTLWLLNDDDDGDGEPEPPVDGPGGLVPGTRIYVELIDPFDQFEVIESDIENGFDVDDDRFPSAARAAFAGRAAGTASCSFSARFATRVRVWVDGTYIGEADELLLLEDSDAPGHYPYTQFDGMRMVSTGSAIVIQDELAISNGF